MGLRVNGCCCCTLRTAGLIHGWAGILFVSFNIIMIIVRAISYQNQTTYHDNSQENLIGTSAGLVTCFFDLFISGLIIHGINEDKHLYLLPWLILRAIGLVLAVLAILIMLGVAIYQVDSSLFIAAFFASIFTGLFTWSWIVMYSLYKEIQRMVNEKSLSSALPYLEGQNGQLGPTPPYKLIEK